MEREIRVIRTAELEARVSKLVSSTCAQILNSDYQKMTECSRICYLDDMIKTLTDMREAEVCSLKKFGKEEDKKAQKEKLKRVIGIIRTLSE